MILFSPEQFKTELVDTTANDFEAKALALFQYQAEHNPVYRQYITALRILPAQVQNMTQIPFLPIDCFKYHKIQTLNPTALAGKQVVRVFESSGTTGQINSKHYVSDLDFYEHISLHGFEEQYGSIQNYHILALLPSYLERSNSSLVYMVEAFMRKSQSIDSGFYLQNIPELLQKINLLRIQSDRKILLIGVTFALLDLAEQFEPNLEEVIVMETGGMKGRRKELIREELHEILCGKLNVNNIHAEYGMTELRSQAYSKGEGIFSLPAWCKVLLREVHDPLDYSMTRTSGIVNIIDLANVESCAFIATQDLAIKTADNTFKIIGRADNSDIRGCNLLVY